MQTLPQFFREGKPTASLPPDDAYDDGLLETMRCQHGAVPLWSWHCERLRRSGQLGGADLVEMGAVIQKIAANCGVNTARLRLRWGYLDGRPSWDLSLLPLGVMPDQERGVGLFPCKTRLPALETANRGCKRLCRSRYNRARAELPGDDCEGLLLDSEGRVIESLRCNLLARIDGAWVTPDLRRCGVRGVMREWLRGRIPLREVDLTIDALCSAEEVALCNSLRGLVPVRELIGHRTWPVEMPGGFAAPETRRLQRLIAKLLW